MAHRLRIGFWLACGLVCFSLRVRADEPAEPAIAQPVGQWAVDLGFQIQQMAFDPAGKMGLVWGRKVSDRRGYDPNAANEPMPFALVDLDRHKLLATQNETAEIELACLDEQYIYLALAGGNALYRLDRTDLSKRTRLALDGQPSRIEALPGGKLAVRLTNRPNTSVAVFDRETLARTPRHCAEMDSSPGNGESPLIAEQGMDSTLVFRDNIVDAATGEIRCALEMNPLPPLVDSAARKNSIPAGRSGRKVFWGRTVSGNALTTAQGAPLAIVEWGAVLSAFDPLLTYVRYDKGDRHILRSVLEFREIKQGALLRAVDLGDSVVGQEPHVHFGRYPTPPLQIVKDKAIYRDGTRIICCPIPEDVKKKAVAPLALKIPKIPVASVENAVEVQFAMQGGEGTPTFALTKGYDGLSIDAIHGKVTIDLPKIWKQYLAGGGQPATPFAPCVQPALEIPDTPAIFERLTGAPLPAGKTALRLPLRVAQRTRPASRMNCGCR